MLGNETAETNLRTLLLPCYLQLLGNVTMLFAAVGGIDVRERECGDESADDAVAMLFAAVSLPHIYIQQLQIISMVTAASADSSPQSRSPTSTPNSCK